MQKAVSDSGVQRDCVRLSRHIIKYMSDVEKLDKYCSSEPGAGNYICTTNRCNAAAPSATATRSLVFILSTAIVVVTSSAYYALWRS